MKPPLAQVLVTPPSAPSPPLLPIWGLSPQHLEPPRGLLRRPWTEPTAPHTPAVWMGKLRPGESQGLAPSRPRPRRPPIFLLWLLLVCALGCSAQGPGEWAPWGSWSRCSSSCGRGLSVRSRRCSRLPGEQPCWGGTHEYRLCPLPDCPPGATPFRDLQCALYNGRPVLGSQQAYQWVPFYGGSFAGYWNVTVIPEGARHLRVAHRSRNNLALMAPDGHYLLNGNRAVSPPGAYEVAGTRLVYTQEASLEETLQAEGPTSQDLILQVLLQEPNPGIEFEFWLPRERYGPFQAQTQALGWAPRQPQPRGLEPQPAARRTTPSASPPPSSAAAPDACPPCPDSRGRAHRIRHYCGSDFVLRARVLGLLQPPPQDTRYEVEVQQVYKQRSPLRTREYLWAPGRCPCPALGPGHDFLLAARRVLSPDRTRDRLLLPRNGYARPWSPAEDSRVRLAARRCQS
ncbi:ADAMTS-like protein 5 isoform X4 [Erinaceus europaeus]|uniref:ADAMTS-like protein 5 isoform X4 n=1 Tax=Erinaceus europaeus TaxID=9365 RepID=A0ABM3WLP0_ERIEU|nr:ADAMTS-like protein 5 isoform X4 [Erinaceus europaeus]